MIRTEHAAHLALVQTIATRDSRAPEVIRRQRDAIARWDARKRSERIRARLSALAVTAIVAGGGLFLAYNVGAFARLASFI